MRRFFPAALLCFFITHHALAAPAPKYAAPQIPAGNKAVITIAATSPTLTWDGDKLVVTAAGTYNYMNDHDFQRIEIDVKWSRNQGAPLILQGPTGSISPEESVRQPPNGTYTISATPAIPPAGYTDVTVTVRIVVKKPGFQEVSSSAAAPAPVAIPPK